ncbi:hypothetical protein BCR32DRAFT_297599 [Anaeromyces robustus]|jgi:hypothetical protein|uniref:Uncharacterized protein n=1 Tax=Anaeromyces robustus TaxID=1754192 RepID=A0A1Y1W076_9FUNG|nr:hypothetical protein BCR32DRAFT_297599 [Anaeromyces robustus]|eukprot:ORX66666.1 hypothetical protein BCR32DRAFT_297599 [Anaeromyces robustus]
MKSLSYCESYPIHSCIYRNDLKLLKEILKKKDIQKLINKKDNHGNSPIQLALMLNRHNCLMALLEYDCNIFDVNHFGWKPLDEASMLNDVDAIEKIYRKIWKIYHEKVTSKGGYFEEMNKTAPNLFLKLKLKIKTTIPILSRLNTTAFLTVHKNKHSMKTTITIGGIDLRGVPKIIKGNMSVLVHYNKKTDEYRLYAMNNAKKIYQELFPNIPESHLKYTVNTHLGSNKIISVIPDFNRTVIKPRKGNLLKNIYKKFTLENGKSYRAVAYKLKYLDVRIYNRKDEAIIGENESIIKNIIDEPKTTNDSNKQNRKFIIDNDDSKSTKDSELDNSDIEPDYDSESDIEESCNSKQEDEKLINLFDNNTKGKKKEKEEDIMYTVNKDGETRTFKYETTMESTTDWEEAYREKYSKGVDLMYGVLGYDKNNETVIRLSPQEIERLNLHKVTEEEYFNPSNTKPLHLGRIMNVNEETKSFKRKIRLWIAKDSSNFPISLRDMKSLLDFLVVNAVNPSLFCEPEEDISNETSPMKLLIYSAYKFLTETLYESFEEKNAFPLKIIVPLYPSVTFEVTTIDCSIDSKYVPDSEFDIPDDYDSGVVYFEHIEK